MVNTAIPYGLRDVKITPYTDDAATTLADSSIDLPYSRTMSFTEVEEFQEMRGDDMIVTTRGSGASVEWELEAGGLSIPAVKAIYGGTVTTTGVAPNEVTRWSKKTTDARPFFKVEGQSISDSGGDIHGIIYKARATDNFEGQFADGEFFATTAKGKGVGATMPDFEDVVYEFVQNSSATPIA